MRERTQLRHIVSMFRVDFPSDLGFDGRVFMTHWSRVMPVQPQPVPPKGGKPEKPRPVHFTDWASI
jgi:hypothetical protein